MLPLLLACAGPVNSDTTLTDGETWQVQIGALAYDQGAQDLSLQVRDADQGQGVSGLDVTVSLGMSGMQHDDQPLALDDLGDGAYSGQLLFTMAGVWTLDGVVSNDSTSEYFSFNIQATP